MKKVLLKIVDILLYAILIIMFGFFWDIISPYFALDKAERSAINDGNVIYEKTINVATKEDLNSYFYDQLDEDSKKIYDVIVNNLSVLKNGDSKIYLNPDEFSEILGKENGTEELKKRYQNAWDALKMDRVDMFYIDSTKVTLTIQSTRIINKVSYTIFLSPKEGETYFANGFSSREEVEGAERELEKIRSDFCDTLSGNAIDDITAVNDFIVERTNYTSNTAEDHVSTIYGCLINQLATCEGYAKTFKYFMDYLKIKNILVIGDGANGAGNLVPHMWNYVCLNDKWYGVDVTWNDPIPLTADVRISLIDKHAFLLKKEDVFAEEHFTDGHVIENGYVFTYPKLES